MKKVLATLDAEDLGRYRLLSIRLESMRINPSNFSRPEIDDLLRQEFSAYEGFDAKYGLKGTWQIDRYSGEITEAEE